MALLATAPFDLDTLPDSISSPKSLDFLITDDFNIHARESDCMAAISF